jgi:hypothetical protein
MWHKAALWLVALRRHGYDAKIYRGSVSIIIRINPNSLERWAPSVQGEAAIFANLVEGGVRKKFANVLEMGEPNRREESRANAVKATLSVRYNEQNNTFIIMARPGSKEAYDAIMRRLLDAGLIEDKDLTADEVRNAYVTARPPRDGEQSYIHLKIKGLEQLIRNALIADIPAAEELRKEIESQIERLGGKARERYEEIKEKALSEGVKEFKGVKEVTLEDGTTAKVELEHIEARIDEEGNLRIKQRFKVDGVEVESEMVFKRYRGVAGHILMRNSRGVDRRRLLAYCEAVGLKPSKLEESPGNWVFSRKDLDALMQFREVAEPIREWLSKSKTAG